MCVWGKGGGRVFRQCAIFAFHFIIFILSLSSSWRGVLDTTLPDKVCQ